MKATRRTKIRVEKHELKLVRLSGNTRHFCQNCLTETAHFPITQMAALLGVSERTAFRLAEIELVHSTETADGKLLICAASAATFKPGKILGED